MRTNQSMPFTSRIWVTRMPTASTTPVAGPTSTTSPTPSWSSATMKMPLSRSFTMFCAPKARPAPTTLAAPTMATTSKFELAEHEHEGDADDEDGGQVVQDAAERAGALHDADGLRAARR